MRTTRRGRSLAVVVITAIPPIPQVARPRRDISGSADGRRIRVRVRLDERVLDRSVLALHYGPDGERRLVLEDVGEGVADGEVYGLDVDVVL